MQLEYCKNAEGNFGDDLNGWLWPQLIPDLLAKKDNNFLIGIGTILSHQQKTIPAEGKKIVFSSGTGYKVDAKIDETWDIIGVRGEKTAQAYHLSSDKILCDGAYLLRHLVDDANCSDKNKIGFMPHHSSIALFDWPLACQKLGLHYISPQQTVETVLENMKHCNSIITEAMHGAIVADALRIPWCAVSYSPSFLKFKWNDWTSVLDIDALIHQLPFVLKTGIPVKQVRSWKIKQFAGSLGLGKEKWRNFPKINANNENIDALLDTLNDLKQKHHFQLSSNESILNLDNKLKNALQYLKKTY